MNSSFFGSKSGLVLAAAGITLAELTAGLLTSVPSPAHALSVELPTHRSSIELAGQASDSQMAKDDDMAEDDVKLLPESIRETILKDVSRRSGMQASQLRIVKVERQTWSDGCLGLGSTDTVCTQSLVPGWRVILASGERRWVYRTNQVGSAVKLDEVASRTISSETTTQVTRREQLTTRTTQTTQAIAGSAPTTQDTSTRVQQAAVTRTRAQVNFTDVPEGYWAKDFIAELAGRGILTGFPDGKFHPNEPVTRAQFAALVASVFKKNKVRNVIGFRDVSTTHWAYQGIRDAYQMGFLGVNSRSDFSPSQSLTRLQILTALGKGLNYTATSSSEKVLQFYKDAAAIPADARNLVAAVTERGIVANYPNITTCSPNQVATRAEVAAFLYQAMVSTGDAVAISSPYVAGTQTGVTQTGVTQTEQTDRTGQGDRVKPARQNCNQGIGNGAEGCDPGNSRPHGGSNDEGGRTPGNRPK